MTDAVIIGAGPYGLSVAANLKRRGVSTRIFGQVMKMWTDHMPAGMVLKSDGFATNLGRMPLTLERFCANNHLAYGHLGHRTPIADVIAYARAFEREYIGAVDNRTVVDVRARTETGYLVTLDDGETIATPRVIVATGLKGNERLPAIEGMPDGKLTHASEHADLSVFRDKRVVVIGAGQSAFETSALLHEQGAKRVIVLSRRPPFWFDPAGEGQPSLWARIRHPNWGLGPGYRQWLWSEAPRLFHLLPQAMRLNKAYSTFGPAGSGWLKHRVVDVPGITLKVAEIVRAEAGDKIALTISESGNKYMLRADHVIAATGYRPNLHNVACLSSLLSAHAGDIAWIASGIPKLNAAFETSLPGLHVVGALSAPSWGPTQRFIYGTNFAGPRLAEQLKGYTRKQIAVGTLSKQPA